MDAEAYKQINDSLNYQIDLLHDTNEDLAYINTVANDVLEQKDFEFKKVKRKVLLWQCITGGVAGLFVWRELK